MKGFRSFVLRGNVVDLAVGVVIGVAFQAVVSAFVAAFLTPLIGLITGITGDISTKHTDVVGVSFPWGVFVNALISFLLLALVVYVAVVVPLNKLVERFNPHPDSAMARQDCPACLSSIPVGASRCAFCTSDVPPVAQPEPVEA
jgi:large conductance mechanosensitive channel